LEGSDFPPAATPRPSRSPKPGSCSSENIALIKSCVGDAIAIKAAGGVRGLDTVMEMYRLGARRFGIGLNSAIQIFEECAARSGGVAEY
jgi:deoxyribose-phosphate aldolase